MFEKIKFLVIVVVLVVGGYVAYRFFWQGESLDDVMPIKDRAKAAFVAQDWEKSIDLYKEALIVAHSGKAEEKDKLTDEEAQACFYDIGVARYRIAQASNWDKAQCRQAIADMNNYLKRYKHKAKSEDVKNIEDKIEKTRTMSGAL